MTPRAAKPHTPKRVWYSVAMSLDGYIARADGSYDWIPNEPEIDWPAFMGRFDTVLMGRKTWEVVSSQPGPENKDTRTFVFSRTLRQEDHPGITVVARDPAGTVEGLRKERGKDIWLMGGGKLFRSLLDAGAVDVVEIGLVPVILGGGIPLLPAGGNLVRLSLTGSRTYAASGIMLITYDVRRGPAAEKTG